MELSELCYIDETGYHYPDYPTVLEWYKEKYRGIYGADVYLEADSQDGQWVAINAKAAFDCMALGYNIFMSFSPASAVGNGLARMVKINGIKKQIATKSSVDLKIIGTVGTTIENGIAQDQNDIKWNLPALVVIPVSGEIVVTAEAQDVGAISALPNTINKIFTPTLGWQTVNNESAAALGVPVETDAQLRNRQKTSTALPSLTVFEGTIGGLQNIEGVSRVKGYENDSNTTDADGIPAHSVSFVVEGGDVQEIGDEIARRKTPGTGTYGTTDVDTVDKYGMPNQIHFFRPTIVSIDVQVTLQPFPGYSSANADLIKAAIMAHINALNIGDDVFLGRLYVPANLPGTVEGSTYNVDEILIAKHGETLDNENIEILFNEAASVEIANILVVVL